MWKYFSYLTDPRIKGVKKFVIDLADEIRRLSGVKMVITSGIRPPKTGSAHEKGLAMDVRSGSWRSHFKLIKAAIDLGVRRIGVYFQPIKCPHCKSQITGVKLKPSHFHFDKDDSKDQDVMWIGMSK